MAAERRRQVAVKRERLAQGPSSADVQVLREEIQALEASIDELEREIAELQAALARAAETKTPAPTANPTVHVGPRGGCYRISKNGKKYYVKC